MQKLILVGAILKKIFIAGILITSFVGISQGETSKSADAKFLIERLTGTKIPFNHPLILKVAAELELGNLQEAADLAIADDNFINVVVRDMAQKMSNRPETIDSEFNDFTAMFLGVARDNADARDLVTANYSYKLDATELNGFMTSKCTGATFTVPVNPETYSETTPYRFVGDRLTSNKHFTFNYESKCKDPNTGQIAKNSTTGIETLFEGNLGADAYHKINVAKILQKEEIQKVIKEYATGGRTSAVPHPDPAGVLTLRAFGSAHFEAGTNRRAVEFTFREFMCISIENWGDTKVSDERIGMDVTRFPGGSYEKFATTCKACHTGMDGFRGAFAKYNFTGGRMVHGGVQTSEDARTTGFSATGIADKMNQNNNVFPNGYTVIDDSFINNARGTVNAVTFGWRGNNVFEGNGLHDLGKLIANSERYSQCFVKRAFDQICNKTINIDSDSNYVKSQAQKFEAEGYKLKSLFRNIATSPECFGGM